MTALLSLPFLLAAPDVGEWIGMAVLLLSFLGWIVNAIKGNTPEGQPKPVKPQPPRRDLRSELEVFLEELQGGKNQPQPRPKPQAQPVARKQPRQPKKPEKKPQLKPQPKPTIGGGVREHVATYMAPDRVTAHAQAHIGQHRIDEAVARDLAGGTVAAIAPVDAPRSKPHPLLQVLSQPEGMRQAILLQEILQKPRALRSGSSHAS